MEESERRETTKEVETGTTMHVVEQVGAGLGDGFAFLRLTTLSGVTTYYAFSRDGISELADIANKAAAEMSGRSN